MATTKKTTTTNPATPPKPPKPPKKTYADYGFVKAFLDEFTDVKKLVLKAIKDNYTQDRFQMELKNTDWWKKRSDKQRQWDVLSTSNPGEAKKQTADTQKKVSDAATLMGVKLTPAQITALAKTFTANGADDVEIRSVIAGKFAMGKPGTPKTGEAGKSIDALTEEAARYGITLSESQLRAYTRDILAGRKTADGMTDVFREQAKSMYPGAATMLDKGMTVADITSPYLQIAEKELGVPADQMKLSDPKWTRAITGGQAGTPMNADQWLETVRTDKRYGWDKTDNARQMSAQVTSELSKMFGVM
jgi:hypothetical protein